MTPIADDQPALALSMDPAAVRAVEFCVAAWAPVVSLTTGDQRADLDHAVGRCDLAIDLLDDESPDAVGPLRIDLAYSRIALSQAIVQLDAGTFDGAASDVLHRKLVDREASVRDRLSGE